MEAHDVTSKYGLMTLSGKAEIADAQAILSEEMTRRCDRREEIQLGFQGGGLPAEVCWNSKFDFWMAFRSVKNRYWSAFGTGNPFEHDSKSIVVEINFPFHGINRHIGGLFLRGTGDKIYLGHRGRIGGGRRGIGKKAFLESMDTKRLVIVNDGDRKSMVVLIGAIDSEEIDNRVASFVYGVARFKMNAVGQ